MKKRFLSLVALVLALLLSLSFAACKKATEEPAEQPSDETPVIDPENVDAEGHALPQPTISTARISGDYEISGSATFADGRTEEIAFSMNVFPAGENLSVTLVLSEDAPSTTFTVTDYDPLTGKCTFPVLKDLGGGPIPVTFSDNGGRIKVSMQFDLTSAGISARASYEGQKK